MSTFANTRRTVRLHGITESLHSRTLAPYFLLALSLVALPLNAQLLPTSANIDATAVDSNGFIYVAGTIGAAELPVTSGVLQSTPPANCPPDVCVFGFVAKVAPTGDSLVWATYFYEAGIGGVTRLAVAKDGSLYVARSAPNTVTLPSLGGYQSAKSDIFIAELSADGKSLLAASYLGGIGDTVAGLQLDAAGNVYVAGTARSLAFPTTSGAYQRQAGTGPVDSCNGPGDQFVAKFDRTLKSLVLSTLFGGARPEKTDAFAMGPDGSLYLTGTRGTPRGPCWDVVLFRLSADASTVIYSKTLAMDTATGFFGGYALAVDSTGAAYVGGDSRVFIPPSRGVIVKFDPLGVKVSERALGGTVSSLALSNTELVVTGSATSGVLATTPDSPTDCAADIGLSQTPYVARLKLPSMEVAYAGYLPARSVWLAGPGQVLTSYAYTGTVPFAVSPPGTPPQGTVTCLANSATNGGLTARGFDVAPGEIATLFGKGIGPAVAASAVLDAGGNVTSQLSGLQVLVGGVPAPLLYASPDQINLVLPFGLTPGTPTTVEIRRGGAKVASFPANVVAQRPGLFTLDSTGLGQLAALNQDGSINGADNPAGPGTAVVLFATGLGGMSPSPIDGSRVGQALNRPLATYQATVNGQPAVIEYIGNAPTLVAGLVQINVRLPARAPGAPVPPSTATIAILMDKGVMGAAGTIEIR